MKNSHPHLPGLVRHSLESFNWMDISLKSRNRFLSILGLLLLQLVLAEGVYAATNGVINRGNIYAIAGLLVLVLGLGIYLMVVIIEPERF